MRFSVFLEKENGYVTCLTKGFNFHSEKLWEIDVSDITTFLLNLNIGKQSALSKLSNRYRGVPLSPQKNSSDLHQSHGSTWQRLGGSGPLDPPGQLRRCRHIILIMAFAANLLWPRTKVINCDRQGSICCRGLTAALVFAPPPYPYISSHTFARHEVLTPALVFDKSSPGQNQDLKFPNPGLEIGTLLCPKQAFWQARTQYFALGGLNHRETPPLSSHPLPPFLSL